MQGIGTIRLSARVAAAIVLSAVIGASAAPSASASAGLQLSRAQGAAGDVIGVRGALLAPSPVVGQDGIRPSEPVNVFFDADLVGYTQTDWFGNFTTRIVVPLCAEPGAHTVTAIGAMSHRSSWSTFTVIGTRPPDAICQ